MQAMMDIIAPKMKSGGGCCRTRCGECAEGDIGGPLRAIANAIPTPSSAAIRSRTKTEAEPNLVVPFARSGKAQRRDAAVKEMLAGLNSARSCPALIF